MSQALMFALASGVLAILYGAWSVRWILAQPEGQVSAFQINLDLQVVSEMRQTVFVYYTKSTRPQLAILFLSFCEAARQAVDVLA